MNDQPKPATVEQLDMVDAVAKYGIKKLEPATGEWTAKSVFTLYGHPNNVDGWQVIADAHNAALAKVKE